VTKTILLAIAATLILGTFALGNSAFAVESGDVISFKGQTNKVVVDPASELPSNAKARVGIQLNVTNVDEFYYDGLNRMSLQIVFSTPQSANGFFIQIEHVLAYTYDELGNQLRIHETEVQDTSGATWFLSGVGSYDLDKKDKSRAEITLNLGSHEGEELLKIPAKGGVVIVPITTG
jgi:hypothetical protein